MSFYLDPEAKSWVVQIQRSDPSGKKLRLCKRVQGTKKEAAATEKVLLREIEVRIHLLRQEQQRRDERQHAAEILGIDLQPASKHGSSRPQTLRDYLTTRWAAHAMVTQNATTRRTTRFHVAYLVFYLGDRLISQIDEADVARLHEGLLRDGPRSFTKTRSGQLRKTRKTEFRPRAVNRIVASLAAALRLAERERVIDRAPAVDQLPADDSEPLVPPTAEEMQTILLAARAFTEVAPLMSESIELATETGMRAGEQFTLPWRSVDFDMGETGAIRIEKQHGVRMVDGRPWTPKHKKYRTIPLTQRARELLLHLRERVPRGPTDPVIPSRGGSPYNRLEAAPGKAGTGYFQQVVASAQISRHVRWHDLRHYFAVRALLSGVPISVVSSWLGHSDVNLTVKTYGRWASEAMEQWRWARVMGEPANAVQPRTLLPPIARSGAGSST